MVDMEHYNAARVALDYNAMCAHADDSRCAACRRFHAVAEALAEAEARGESPPAVIGLETLEDLEAVAQSTLASSSPLAGGADVAAEAANDEIRDDGESDDVGSSDGDEDLYPDTSGESDSADFESQDSPSSDVDDREAESAERSVRCYRPESPRVPIVWRSRPGSENTRAHALRHRARAG